MTTSGPQRLVLFHRDFRAFTGGHLKVWDYFNHVESSLTLQARIAFSAESKWNASNPWSQRREAVVPWQPERADILFLAGTDWRFLPSRQTRSQQPVLNLIQHPRHADQGSELRGFLRNRAIRICVSEEVAAAINETGEVNGPVFVIPNGIDLPSFPSVRDFAERSTDLLICGLKAPELARQAYTHFSGTNRVVRWLIEWIPRTEYLDHLARAERTLFLPRPSEGFYLPPLEGMASDTLVICPDCVGNRSFCLDGVNCFRPNYTEGEIFAAVTSAFSQEPNDRARMQDEARSTARSHSLEHERASFFEILNRVDELWKD